ncbi:hypothetical protein KKA47_04010 [bacterium]|nr:hypothetical protein [bacterium]
MNLKNFLKFLRLVETIPLEYMVSDSIASILYGKPRVTHDMDVVVIFPTDQINKFINLFDTKEYYCPPQEAIEEAIKLGDRGHMNVIDQSTGFKIDIYPFTNDPLVQWGFENKKKVELIADEHVWVAPPEYVILKKLLYYDEGGSQKHLVDIRAMLDVSGDQINYHVIEEWAAKLGVKDHLKSLA